MPASHESSTLRAAAAGYFDANTTMRDLDVTEVDASIALASGVYEMKITGSVGAFVRHGADTAGLPPSSGAAAVAGYAVDAGAYVTIVHDDTVGDGALHIRLEEAGAESAIFNRKVLP